ncbi:energy transducer TonB [Stenotrophomonas maltophilia group sp. Smal35]|uniref:energy transducer TonB n=1 Tax=Stenotrophomonas maltophilia group sp. Smal35 TaxID=3377163 RepID=UPI0025550C2B|nr:TonB family protein [Stenotrophomonas maltophilia]
MPRLNTALALNLILMLLGATPGMAMAADPQVSTEVFVERGDNPTFELQQAPAIEYSTAPATPPDTFLQAPMQVLLVAQLDELGHVSNVMVVRSSGLREIDRAAFTAVDQWRFEPVVVEGVALVCAGAGPSDLRAHGRGAAGLNRWLNLSRLTLGRCPGCGHSCAWSQ